MPGSYLSFPFDEDVFNYRWGTEPDPVKTAMLQSGALVANAEIAAQIAGGGYKYSVPFYKTIGGTPVNYDGKTDITSTETSGAYQSGVVYGRANAWTARDFVADFNSGADPMGHIVASVASFWAKYRQKQLINIANGCFGVTDNGDFTNKWADHTHNIAATSTTIGAANKVSETTFSDAAQMACGDNDGIFSMAIMHSAVAKNLANLQLLEYRKYTDPSGIERTLRIADVNGLLVVVDDGVPAALNDTSKAVEYTSYLFGAGALNYAPAPVDHPSEIEREPKKNGGQDTLITRIRETILPNGFSYTEKTGDGVSPTDEQLGDKSRYSLIHDPKAIAMAKIVSNG